MTNNFHLNADQVKKLHQIENMALMLDKACQDGEISDEATEKAQSTLNKISAELINKDNSLGSRAYIIYETQALLHWIAKDKDEAYDFIKIASNIKGDGDLLTATANDLLSAAGGAEAKTSKGKSLVGVRGWLWWVSLGIGLSILTIAYSELQVIAAASGMSSLGWGWYVVFCSILNLGLITISIAYLIQISKESVLAKKLGILFFACAAIALLLDAGATSIIYNYSSISEPYDLWYDAYRACLTAFVWIPYFLNSKRVKATLIK